MKIITSISDKQWQLDVYFIDAIIKHNQFINLILTVQNCYLNIIPTTNANESEGSKTTHNTPKKTPIHNEYHLFI